MKNRGFSPCNSPCVELLCQLQALYQGASSLAPHPATIRNRALAPAPFLLRQISIAILIFAGTLRQPRLYRILRNIRAIPFNTCRIIRPRLRKSNLPNLSQIAAIVLQPIRKSPLYRLHGLFNRRIPANAQKQMHVIRHYDKVVHLKLSRSHIRTQNIDRQRRVPFRLQQPPSLVGFGCGEKCARRTQRIYLRRIANRPRHSPLPQESALRRE